MSFLLIYSIGFAFGSIPFGILLAKLFGLVDPRTIGSGNIGATNMLRTGNKRVAALTLILDALKGFMPVLFAFTAIALEGPPYRAYDQAAAALLGAIMGHCFTPWLKGKGGKGVATALGGALAFGYDGAILYPCLFCGIWISGFILTRYVSVASILALATLPILPGLAAYWLGSGEDVRNEFENYTTAAIFLGLCAIIGIYKHRPNIARLIAGTEPKMGRKK